MLNRFIYCCVFFTVFLLLGNATQAQDPKYSTTSKGAIREFEEGIKYYDSKNSEKALAAFEKAISKDSSFIEAHMLKGDVLAEMQKFPEAVASYLRAVRINPVFFPKNLYQLGKLEFKIARYADAKSHLLQFLSLSKGAPEEMIEKSKSIVRSCDFAIIAMRNPVPFDPVNLGAAINTDAGEYYPSFTVDQNEVIFTRDVKDSRSYAGQQEDFYISRLKDTVWQMARNAGAPLNSANNEGAPSISSDGRILFYTACDREGGQGSCDIYLSQRMNDGSWTRPLNLGPPINTGAWETQPSFSSDGKTIYFIRGVYDRNRRMVQDIYSSTFQEDMTWSEPVPLNSLINSPGKEESVFIHPDNQTLYFSSDGLVGMGGLDIYVSRKNAEGEWGEPVNLGYPINTAADENSLVVSADGMTAYFASDRAGGFGDLDLYKFNLYPAVRPLLVSYLKARVIDAVTGMPLAAKFEIIDVESGKVVLSNTTDKKRGEFLACLPSGKNYMLNVNKEGYLFYSDYFECKNATDKQHAFEQIIKLQIPKSGEGVVLKNIFFETSQFALKPESNAELNKLSAFLKANPNLKIEISGHTDSKGDVKANQLLSENRAKSVYDFMVTAGIPAARLTYKGYGDQKPVASNDTETGRALNRRTEFTIL
ncbi:OmpA family protein [soil metagenome]